VPFHAVVFDLWETLVRWPQEESGELRRRWAARLQVPTERLDELWYGATYRHRETGPLAPVLTELCRELGSAADVDELLRWRLDLARTALVPDAGVVETLADLRRRGVRLGLISNCTEDVALVWTETAFAEWIDAPVFSATAGCAKPYPEIYRLACNLLGVDPSDCLFVGDGANDELAGAARVGMTPVLIHRPGEDPHWPELRAWPGERVARIPDVLALL
jgi:putative hydrolase of the HAD superfamily